MRACALACLAMTQHSCGAEGVAARRFALRPTLWVDNDTRPLPRPPRRYESALVWDAVDHQVFRPLTRGLLLETGSEATNVNALDEVPDSSWFTNRLSIRAMTPELLAQGACAPYAPPPSGVWTITSSKQDGWTPGFIARGPDGARYVVKTDGGQQSEQPSGADVIASRFYWAAGYHTPCNRVVRIPRSALQIGQGATFEDELGNEHPLTNARLEQVLARASRYPDGTVRLGISRFVDGRPLGPFRFEGTRDDDPNDVVPHEDRRDLRGARLLAAWLNHFDAREQNTLTAWIPGANNTGHVRHYMLDFSDCMGGIWPVDGLSRRMGHSHYFDVQHIVEDWISLGLIDRPWEHARTSRHGWIFAYYGAAGFEPDRWRAGYPNPAFARMTEHDGAWMARILARITPAHIHAAIPEGAYSLDEWNSYLERVLVVRRERVLRRYLTRLSPLADFEVQGETLCAGDRAVEAGLYPAAQHTARLRYDGRTEREDPLALSAEPQGRVCVRLPALRAASAGVRDGDASQYRVVEITTRIPGTTRSPALRAHLYDLGPGRGYALAGIER